MDFSQHYYQKQDKNDDDAPAEALKPDRNLIEEMNHD
jgi:hypothetical protein